MANEFKEYGFVYEYTEEPSKQEITTSIGMMYRELEDQIGFDPFDDKTGNIEFVMKKVNIVGLMTPIRPKWIIGIKVKIQDSTK